MITNFIMSRVEPVLFFTVNGLSEYFESGDCILASLVNVYSDKVCLLGVCSRFDYFGNYVLVGGLVFPGVMVSLLEINTDYIHIGNKYIYVSIGGIDIRYSPSNRVVLVHDRGTGIESRVYPVCFTRRQFMDVLRKIIDVARLLRNHITLIRGIEEYFSSRGYRTRGISINQTSGRVFIDMVFDRVQALQLPTITRRIERHGYTLILSNSKEADSSTLSIRMEPRHLNQNTVEDLKQLLTDLIDDENSVIRKIVKKIHRLLRNRYNNTRNHLIRNNQSTTNR